MHRACAAGQAEAAQALLAGGASPAARTEAGLQPLHLAAGGGHVQAILVLLLGGADVDAAAPCTGTPLCAAVAAGQQQAVQVLLGSGAQPDAGCICAAVPHADGSEGGGAALLSTLLAAGAPATQQALRLVAGAGNAAAVRLLLSEAGVPAAGSGAVVEAARAGSLEALEALLEAGEPPDEDVDSSGRTCVSLAVLGMPAAVLRRCWRPCACDWDVQPGMPVPIRTGEVCTQSAIAAFVCCRALAAAAAADDLAVMERLLAAGANPDHRPERRQSVLERAASAAAVRLLIEAGATVEDPAAGYFPLLTAARQGRAEAVAVLLEAGAAVDARDPEGLGTVHLAAMAGSQATLAVLLAAGADPAGAVAGDGCTPLHISAALGQLECVQVRPASRGVSDCIACRSLTMERGWSLLRQSESYPTPPLLYPGALQALLTAGANVVAADSDGSSALHAATHGGSGEVVAALLEAGAPANSANAAGEAPLHFAAEATRAGADCRLGALTALLMAGADHSATTRNGDTPLTLALAAGNLRCAWALLAAGATPSTRALTCALLCRQLRRGGWMAALLPSGKVSSEQLREWAGAACHGRQRQLQQMLQGVWTLRALGLPPEVLRRIAAMRCLVG